MLKAARTLLLAVVLCAFTGAPAHATFFPDLTVALSPGTAVGTPALTAMIAQPATDTPIERFTLSLPAGFKPVGAPAATACALPALRAGTCTPASQVGVFGAQLGRSAPVSGAIHKTGPKSFGLVVSLLGGAVRQAVEGSLVVRESGALDLKLDRLPALPLTQVGLRFWGGARSFIETPAICGVYTVDGKFTSRLGELAIDRSRMPIEGCTGVPAVQVEHVRLSAWSFRAGGSIYGTRTIIAWWASKPAERTEIRIMRRVRGAWRPLGVLVATGGAGDNRVRWDGRLKGRALKPGRYGLRVKPAGSEPTRLVRFKIVA